MKEDSDVSRERGSWFFDQRAYPNKHIPEGALQRAIEQRDAMKAQQQLAGGPQTGANGIISFPGDALWHLMGPQPVNEPFTGTNTGYPTASGRVTAIAVDPSTPSTVYIGGAAGGVWKTTDGGTTWTPLTDSQPSLAVGSIAIDPNSCSPAPCSTIYVGTGEDNFNGDAFYGAGVLKSTNGGSTWTQSGGPFAGALSPTFGGAKIGAIAVQPGNSSIVLAAAYFFDGNDPRGGIYRSTDGGQTWALPTTGGKGSAGTGVVFESSGVGANPPIAWAALGDVFSGASSNGIWKSTDLGVTWTLQTSVLPTVNVGRITLGYAANTTGATATLYAAIADSSTTSAKLLGLFKTTNGGTTWSAVTGPSVTGGFCASQCFYDMAIGVQPTNASVVVLGGGPGPDNFTSLFESQDGGTTWTPSGTLGSPSPGNFANGSTTTHVHVDTHAVVFAPNGGTLYVGDDGGIWSTTTPTPASTVSPTWTDLNGGLAITQFYPGPSAGISDENFGLGGTQDNDTEIFTGALGWTNAFTCGDGGSTAIDPAVPTTVYTTCDRGAQHIVNKSVFNGALLPNPTFSGADTGITHGDRMQFIPPLTIDENNPNTLYFGTFRVYQTNDGAATWTPISADLGAGVGNITTFDVAHQSSSIVVAGTSNGKVWESLNATAGALSTWTEIDNGQLPNRHITAVRTERSDSTGNIVFATLSGFGACSGCGATPGHVFVTTNATSGAPTWTNISGDLPDIPVNDLIVFHQGSPTFDALYIATDVGVFSCTNPSATLCANWTVIGDGLPNSPVLGLAMRRPSRILHAATHGRSMWQIQLTDVSPGPLASITSVTPATAFVGDPATAVTINGFNFSANTAVFLNGVSVGTPTFVSTTQLNVTLASTFFQTGGVFPINLMDTAGVDPNFVLGASGAPFTVMNPILGTPTLTNPTTTAGTPYTMHFTGSNFVNSTTVTLTTFGNFTLGGTASSNGTVFDVQVPASLLITAMPVSGTITNPVPGGGPTPAFPFNFTVNAGTIVFSPNPIALTTFLGTTSFPVMNVAVINTSASSVNITAQSITGTNAANFSFAAPTSGTTCNFPTSGQTGTGTITLAANGTCNFGITYTAATPPGNAVSNATLNVTDTAAGSPQTAPIKGTPLPATVLLAPVNFGAVAVGTTSTTMNATLANFSGSSISVTSAFTVSGTNLADFNIVPFVANGDGNAACPAAVPFPLASGASCDVSLAFTPSLPAGNETAQLNVTASVAITTSTPNLIGIGIEITSISPSIVATGGPAFTLTVNGGGFAPSAVVNVGPNGTNPRLTTFVNANQLLASIPASDIAAAGTLPISVTTPNPGGTTSEPKTLFIAQAPTATNDNINFAVNASTTPFRVTQDTTQATTDTGGIADPTPCAPSSKARSVWFKFVAPASGRVVADTRFSSYTTILSAWTGTPGSLVAVASACASGNISGAKPQSSIGFSVSSGTTYFLMVTDANTTGPGGTLTFSLDFASAAPANDPFASPTNIASAPFSTTENTILATPNTGATDPTPSCAPAGAASGGMANSVWFSYTPSSNGTISTDTLTSPYDTILTVVTGSPGSFTQIACNDNASAGIAQSQVSFAATSGTHYFFMISSVLGDGGTTSFHLNFTASVGNPVPTLTSFSPANAAAGGAAFALTVNGTNFVSGATGTFNGNARTVTFVSATQVTMAVTAADIATAGSFPVIISNPGPGGGASAPLNFQVNNPAATLTSLSPSSTTVGGVAFNLIITGSNFVSGATGTFNGNARTVTFNSSTQVTMAVTAPDIATAGSFAVNVSNPAPGGGSNGALLFNVNNVVPTITTIAPTSATVGGATFNLTVTGTGYISGSAVKFNGTSVTTTFNSSTQLTGAISSALIASVGSFPVTVTNAAPGGGVSNSVNFNVTAGAPATMTANAGTTPQSATISTAFANPLAVTVKDAGSNPVSGVNVTFTAPGSGASGTFSNSTAAITVATNASGVASAPFTANATAGGPYTVTAAASGLTTVNFSLTNTAGAAKTM
ncbi:MAG TPA: hypothetical protein VJN89_22055, partial [Candidatus Acidoferrum sp.]|nr:hypothetical protein [Candidatus Acidoferrum sp.]